MESCMLIIMPRERAHAAPTAIIQIDLCLPMALELMHTGNMHSMAMCPATVVSDILSHKNIRCQHMSAGSFRRLKIAGCAM